MIQSLLESIDPDQEVRSLDFDSPYLEQLRTLSDQGDYSAIAGLCEELAAEGIFDIRLLLMGLYSETREDPLRSLPSTLETLQTLFGEAWGYVGPEDKKAKYAKGSLAWLIKQIRVDLELNQVDQTSLWSEWVGGSLFREDMVPVVSLIDEVKRLIVETIEEESQPALLAFNELVSWFNGELIPALVSSSDEAESTSSQAEEDVADSRSKAQAAPQSGSRSVEGSYHLDLLIRKMDLFRQMVEAGDTLKAAIIAADVNATLEQFDPKKYFPQLFAEFLFVMVNQANRIAEAMDMRDTPQWQVLNELYQIDMDKFNAIDVEY